MEIFRNQVIAYLLKLFLIALAMDAVSRFFFDQPINKIESSNENISVTQREEKLPETLLDPSNEIHPTYLGSENQLIYLDVFLCNSCGYKKNFDELKSFLELQIPNIRLVNKEYPVKKSKKILSHLVTALQFAFMILLFFGETLFQKLNRVPPPIFHKIMQYKMFVVFAAYMLGNNINSMLSSSGAFEVVFNNELLYSKLKEGTFPRPEYIYHLIKGFFN